MKKKSFNRTQFQDYDSEFFRNRAERAHRHEEQENHKPTAADTRRWQYEWEDEQDEWGDENLR